MRDPNNRGGTEPAVGSLPEKEEMEHTRSQRLAALTQALAERDASIASLRSELAAMLASKSWRYTALMRDARRRLTRGTRRAFGYSWRIAAGPVRRVRLPIGAIHLALVRS